MNNNNALLVVIDLCSNSSCVIVFAAEVPAGTDGHSDPQTQASVAMDDHSSTASTSAASASAASEGPNDTQAQATPHHTKDTQRYIILN